MMVDLVGESLGPYMITERIGRGGMADVYKAFHTSLSVYRAVKVIRPEFVTSDDFRARFQKEARSVAQLRHPNIVQVHDFGSHGDAFYMVMEFIEGRDLKKVVTSEGQINPIRRAVELVLHIATALEYAHGRGLIHRDIKPENVMIDPEGRPILTDFGIAKLITGATQLTQTGSGIGTPAYMSPEQAQGLSDVGPEADIYALSVVLFELLTGRVPFEADTPVAVILKSIRDPLPMPRSLRPDISEALQAVIIKGTAKSPDDRYSTVSQLRAALERAMADQAAIDRGAPTIVVRDSNAQPVTREAPIAGASRSVAYVASAGAVLALAAIAYFFATRGSISTESATKPLLAPVSASAVSADSPAAVAAPASPARIDAARLSFDRPTTGKTEHAGQHLEYTFDGAAGETIFFAPERGGTPTRFLLTAPDGRQVFESTSGDGPRALSQTGVYRLTAEPQGEELMDIEFTLWRLTEPVIDGGKIEPNVLVEGHTDAPGQVQQFRIDATAGQRMTFALDRASEATDFKLIDPNGNRELLVTDQDGGTIKMPRTGTYVLVADPRSNRPSKYAFTLRSPTGDRENHEPIAKVRASQTANPERAVVNSPDRQAAEGVNPVDSGPTAMAPTAVPAAAIGASSELAETNATPSAALSSGLNQVVKGTTTQNDLLRLFGGPNVATRDAQGRDVWVYERTTTQTDTRSASNLASGSVDFSAFWSAGQASANPSTGQSASALSTGSSIRTVTVIVTFAKNRTVFDYTIKANYF
jgi:tRNA A-37 threonylcarbamoyl transferase component Bud32